MRVSVIVPLHQGARFIADALESLRRQDEPPAEVLVIDDGSTDQGPEVVLRFPEATLMRQPQGGPAAARNRGLAAATGDLVAFLDQDDLLRPAALRRHRETFEARPEVVLSVCRQRFALADGELLPSWQRPELVGAETVAWTPSCLCMRRSVFDTIGRFDESLRATSDSEWVRLFRASGLPFATIDETLTDRRIHAGCQSGDAATIRRELLALARRAARRMRQP